MRFGIQGLDDVQSGLDGLDSVTVYVIFVHAGGVIVADLLIDGGAIGRRPRSVLEDLAFDLEVALTEFIEAAPARLVGWDGVLRVPGAARVLIEVRAGAHVGVHGAEIKPRLAG